MELARHSALNPYNPPEWPGIVHEVEIAWDQPGRFLTIGRMPSYEPVDLSAACNAGLEVLGHEPGDIPLGRVDLRGLPFLIGSEPPSAERCLLLPGEQTSVWIGRFAVMQHLGVLADAGVVVVERRGRDRVNHLNPVPLREWYERWVQPMADIGAASLLALKRVAETGESVMSEPVDQTRTVRLAFELRIEASAQRTFEVMTQQSLDWFPVTYGEDRVRGVVLEPRVGGKHYEDWGDGRGHLYGEVTVYDPPLRWATRGRVMPGTILDTDYRLHEEGGAVVVSVTKVATGPMTAEEAAGIARFGDLTSYAPAIQKLAAA